MAVAAAAAALSWTAVNYVFTRGWTLWFGDAQAHLNIARRIVDSRQPGIDMVGTVWLPLPHLAMLPLVGDMAAWSSGWAGALPAAIAGALAIFFFWAAARTGLDSGWAALAAAACFALNPNYLYLQSTPMTESFFLAALAMLLFGTAWFGRTQSLWAVALAGLAACAATLTRYEGWILLPFVAIYLFVRGGLPAALLFSAIAAIGPSAWLAHNWWQFGDALEFYHGPYSARAIQGDALYPGRRDWARALLQYAAAGWLNAGVPLCIAGAAGAVAAFINRGRWLVVFLALPCAFYVWSVESGTTPVYVPMFEPYSWYNTRYGIAVLPLAAMGAGALVAAFRGKARAALAVVVVIAAVSPWIADPRPDAWITWKESEVNSAVRRQWTREAADYLRSNYRRGDGVFSTFGDVTGVFAAAGIPLAETLTWDIWWQWTIATRRPEIGLRERWAVAIAGDPVQQTVQRAWLRGPRYTLERRVVVKGAPVIEIYRRGPWWSLDSDW